MKVFNTQTTIKHRFGDYDFEIARGGNHAFRNKMKQVSKPYKHEIEKNTLSAEDDDKLLSKAMAGTILVGWKKVAFSSADDKGVPFSVGEAEKTLLEDDILRKKIAEISGDYDAFLKVDEANTIKK